MTRFLIATLLSFGLGAAAAAQGVPQGLSQGVPETLRGPWFAGTCAAPTALLQLTARTAARLPADGPARLWRFTGLATAGDWVAGTARGAEAPRLLLRGAGTALETAEPDPKTRDDRLPGDGVTIAAWIRCPVPPASLILLHAEGLAGLAALERVEAGCGGGTAACVAAIVGAADVTGDTLLTPAEIARLGRGLAWVLAAQTGAETGDLAAAAGLGALASLAGARALVDSLDYDGDGRLSAVELGQDRIGFGAAPGDTAGTPLPLDAVGPALEALRGLVGELDFGR